MPATVVGQRVLLKCSRVCVCGKQVSGMVHGLAHAFSERLVRIHLIK